MLLVSRFLWSLIFCCRFSRFSFWEIRASLSNWKLTGNKTMLTRHKKSFERLGWIRRHYLCPRWLISWQSRQVSSSQFRQNNFSRSSLCELQCRLVYSPKTHPDSFTHEYIHYCNKNGSCPVSHCTSLSGTIFGLYITVLECIVLYWRCSDAGGTMVWLRVIFTLWWAEIQSEHKTSSHCTHQPSSEDSSQPPHCTHNYTHNNHFYTTSTFQSDTHTQKTILVKLQKWAHFVNK